MTCAIKNEKGLNGACYPIALAKAESMREALKAARANPALSEAEKASATELANLILALPGRGSGRGREKDAWVCLRAWPSSWVNGQQPFAGTEEEARQEWEMVAKARALMSKALPAFEKVGWSLKELDESLPKASAIKRMANWKVEAAGAQAAARAAQAWAVWMGGPRELGYMDGKKRPAGAASARLFESASAALRTAKAAKFGGDRGPAAIVRLMIEPLEIVGDSNGLDAVRSELARAEGEALERSMEEASLERLRQMLGEAPAAPVQTIEAGSLAGAEEGYARWAGVGPGHPEVEAGFLSYAGTPGPLAGALLHATERGARATGYYYSSAEEGVVKVRARPMEICELIGEPNVKELGKAIEIERDREEAESLAKAGEGALKARAAALQSGAAQPAPRRSRSL